MNFKTIEQIHENKTGKVSDKWSSYLAYYDSLFLSLRNKPISLLEIGVQNGGSLDTWSDYFQNAIHLVGCDINEKCKNLNYEDPRISLVVGDANQVETVKRISSIVDAYDIIIDDGSHQSNDILKSFLIYFPKIKPGGTYLIEDAHSLYLNEYGGGVLNELSAYSFFKKIIDVINVQFWNSQLSLDVYFRSFFSIGKLPGFIKNGWIESIEFRNSIITITKSDYPTNDKLGKRVIRGSKADVNSEIFSFKDTKL